MESGFKKKEYLLSQIIWLSNSPMPAPKVRQRSAEWCELIVGIGNDEVAHITMTNEALKLLCERNGLNYRYICGQ